MIEGKVTISIQIRKEHTYIHNSFEHLTESEVSKLSEKFLQFEKQLKHLATSHLLSKFQNEVQIERIRIEMKAKKGSSSITG
ncbi:hypothetical protein [Bacillus paranthracis]|uniref:hypothetical protein n=1 Tax=Bacillus paranthracis TaxID=2026186 RepID=UPI0013D8A2B0|nr:hypothetical protein [Bacillus paranthracis]MDK7446692.1 hypothetical protein [Bacillus paranthracis]MDN8630711.1 hypothetical protein [Bacillus paranthracis]MDN8637851.1 hypothetical protein [Bacillus paranthracis]HDR7854652.1 hypothetical protein [Bacillus paranthracis]